MRGISATRFAVWCIAVTLGFGLMLKGDPTNPASMELWWLLGFLVISTASVIKMSREERQRPMKGHEVVSVLIWLAVAVGALVGLSMAERWALPWINAAWGHVAFRWAVLVGLWLSMLGVGFYGWRRGRRPAKV